VTLRQATLADSEFLFRLRNDEATRTNSFSPQMITTAEHEEWLRERLAAPEHCRLYIAEVDGQPVGSARIDLWPGAWSEVSATVDPKHRGYGYGNLIVELLMQEVASLGVKRVTAKVRGFNVPSLRMFLNAGFVPATHVIRLERQS